MASIFTYNQVIELLTDISRRHYQLNTFYLGKDWKLENSEDILYPLFQVYPDFGRLNSNTYGEYKTQDVRFVCKVIDLTVPSEDNEKDVHSDTLRIAQDIVNEFSQHPFYIRSNIRLKGDVEFRPLEEFQDDVAAGWEFILTFQMINLNTFCGMPIENIPGYSATGPESNGAYVDVRFLTCEELPNCPVIQTIDETLIDLQEQIDNLPPSALTLEQVLGYGNTTGNINIASPNLNNILQVSDTVMGMSWNDTVGGNVTLDNSIATIYHDILTQIESQTLINILAPTIISTGETTFNSLNIKGKIDIFDTGINLTYQDTALANLYLDNSISLLYHDTLVQLESTGNINILGSSVGSNVNINSTQINLTADTGGNVKVTNANDNAGLAIVSPAGFYYPSLSFSNNGSTFLGSITGYGATLYISGAGAPVTPLQVSSVVQFPYLTGDKILYTDAINKTVSEVTIGTGLDFTSGTLSATAIGATTYIITTNTNYAIVVGSGDINLSVTALSTGITFTTSGTAINFDKLIVRIKDDGTARALTFDPAFFEAKGMALPTTTVLGKVITIGFIFDSVTNKYGCVSVAQEI